MERRIPVKSDIIRQLLFVTRMLDADYYYHAFLFIYHFALKPSEIQTLLKRDFGFNDKSVIVKGVLYRVDDPDMVDCVNHVTSTVTRPEDPVFHVPYKKMHDRFDFFARSADFKGMVLEDLRKMRAADVFEETSDIYKAAKILRLSNIDQVKDSIDKGKEINVSRQRAVRKDQVHYAEGIRETTGRGAEV